MDIYFCKERQNRSENGNANLCFNHVGNYDLFHLTEQGFSKNKKCRAVDDSGNGDVQEDVNMRRGKQNGNGRHEGAACDDPFCAEEDMKWIQFSHGVPKVAVAQYLCEKRGDCGTCHAPTRDKKKIEIGDYYTDHSKFTKTTGWEPKTGFEEGLEKTVKYYEKNKKYYW